VSWPTVPLGELITPAKIRRAGDDEYPLLSMTMHHGLVPQDAKFIKRVASTDTSSYKVINRGQLVVGFPIDEGVLDFQTLHEEAIVSPAYGVWNLKNGPDVHIPYLKRFLRSDAAIAYYAAKLRGSTARRRSLPAPIFLELQVSLPPIDEQRRIAAILDHVEALRSRNYRGRLLLHTLPQHLFTTMFGDPDAATNTIELGAITRLSGGRNLVGDDPFADSRFRVLKISAVTSGRFIPEESKPLPGDYEPPSGHLVRAGDLLMSRANTTELVGAAALVDHSPSNLALPDKIWRFDWLESGSNAVFYHALLSTRSIRRRISLLSSGSGGSMKNVSKAKLSTMRIPHIPVGQQQEFARLVEGIARRAEQVRQRGDLFERMAASIQARAFRGEL